MTTFNIPCYIDELIAKRQKENYKLLNEMDKKLVQELRERFPETKMTMRFIRYD